MLCTRSAVMAALSVLALLGFFAAVVLSTGCAPSFEKVKDNLNDQRAIYDLDPVSAGDCDELSLAFDGYVELVTYTVDRQDPSWPVIAESECRTLKAHVEAFWSVCPNGYALTQDTIQRCSDAGVSMLRD